MKPRVLLVDGDPARGQTIAGLVSRRVELRQVSSVEEAMCALGRERWAAVIVSHDLPQPGSGAEVLQVVLETCPRAFRLCYSDHFSPGLGRDVERLGIPHFVGDTRAPDFFAVLDRTLGALLEPPSLELPPRLESILADVWTACSPVAQEFLRQLKAAAEQDTPVYVYGEPGTGRTRAGVLLRQWRQRWRQEHPGAAAGPPPPVPVLRVPSLRERPQDLPILAARCLVEHARQSREPMRRLSGRAIEQLLTREWQGNVVELSGVLVRAIQRAGLRTLIEAEDLPQDAQPSWRPSQYAKDAGQRDCVLRQLRTARNVSAAARLEGCSRANYIRLMRRLGIFRADVAVEVEAPMPEEGSAE